jgi:hypothetical protein
VQTATQRSTERQPSLISIWVGICLFSAIAVFFLWEEHRAHILGVLPYVLLGLCPIIHLVTHRGHRAHGEDHAGRDRSHDGRGEGETS